MNESRNLILAVVLSALVLIGWSFLANRYFPTSNPPSTKVENGKHQAIEYITSEAEPPMSLLFPN